ncbi:MAG: glycosyltransferase family 2 protein [Chlorobi bacterium]|nr:glycosyltransferase family 2 protein [Chlorobiota bacterium]
MVEALVITPVKDSLETLKDTIEAVCDAKGNFLYTIYNDFSSVETKTFLDKEKGNYRFEVVHLEDITSNPSPNYKLTLQLARNQAAKLNVPLIIIESDVIIKNETISSLIELNREIENPGMIGAITVDKKGDYNFPYQHQKNKSKEVINTNHSLSFCCTLLNENFLALYDFKSLSSKKHWFDVFISRRSKKLGFNNYLAKNLEVVHLPHSSRPWKRLKYSNPNKYYLYKFLKRRDRI